MKGTYTILDDEIEINYLFFASASMFLIRRILDNSRGCLFTVISRAGIRRKCCFVRSTSSGLNESLLVPNKGIFGLS